MADLVKGFGKVQNTNVGLQSCLHIIDRLCHLPGRLVVFRKAGEHENHDAMGTGYCTLYFTYT